MHNFRIRTTWTGNGGTGTSSYTGYSRDHELSGKNKASVIAASSAPVFRGDVARYNPEELLVGSLSACHMLWFLHLCADAGIVITSYSDDATGTMTMNPDGSGQFTEVVLHPEMSITDESRIEEAQALHERAHAMCFISRSVNFTVKIEPRVTVAS